MTDSSAVALMYSGGTDSTLAAVKAAQAFQQVHLLTYRRFGMFHLQNSERNVKALRERFGQERFVRPALIPVDDLFRHVSYESYLRDLLRHRLMLLTTCGLCKLAMHLRTLVYCHRHGVGCVWDGANRNMTIFPAQMSEVLEMLRRLYGLADIEYENPVFDYDDDQGMDFGSALWGLSPARGGKKGTRGPTTGEELHELGLAPAPAVKGPAYDKQIQGRCYQFVLFNLWARWGYLERKDMARYRKDVLAYYERKIARCERLVQDYLRDPGGSRLSRLCGVS